MFDLKFKILALGLVYFVLLNFGASITIMEGQVLYTKTKYCGVGAHHHNGITEHTIRSISDCARTMLLHAMIHWPEETSLDLWLFAIDYAVHLINCLLKGPSGLSPQEFFYSVKSTHSDLLKYHWFCEKLGDLNVSICQVQSSLQKADIFTKALSRSEFLPKRKLVLGW